MQQVTKTSPFKYPAVDGQKRCTKCLQDLPLSEFGRRVQRGKVGLQAQCTTCRNLRHRLNKRQLTPAEYDALVMQQQGRCYLCDKLDNRLQVDHSHTTGKVRKLLCNRCNWRIGMLEKLPVGWLDQAFRYISDL